MKIGLIDVDSHNFPNLCLMKLSEYHTRRGDRVEWWSPKGRYDLVYKSRVFTDTYSKDTIVVNNAEKVIQGGTGYGPGGKDLPYSSSVLVFISLIIRKIRETVRATTMVETLFPQVLMKIMR